MSDNETTFHNEDAVFRIAMWANIISWVALAVALLQFVNGIVDLYPQWDQFLLSVPEGYKRGLILVNYLVAGPVTGGLFALRNRLWLSSGSIMRMHRVRRR